MQSSAGGPWTEEDHKKLHPRHYHREMSNFIADRIKPTSVLEFGSGLGLVASIINEKAQPSVYHCIEPENISGAYNPKTGPILYSVNIFEEPPPKELLPKYDLVLSIEVAEHIERTLHAALFDFLVDRANNWIVFSGAHVGQGGNGHIACRPEEEWRQEFLGRGATFIPSLTQKIRIAAKARYLKKNLQIFKV